MASQEIAVEIYTTSHRIRGQISPSAAGLYSFLNMPTESYFEVDEAELSILHQIDQQTDWIQKLWLVKSEVVAVLVRNRNELGTSSLARSGYTRPFPHRVRILIDGYILQGVIQSAGKFDFGALMFKGDRPFTPSYNIKLSAVLFPSVLAEAPALLFNRSMVHAISLLPSSKIAKGT